MVEWHVLGMLAVVMLGAGGFLVVVAQCKHAADLALERQYPPDQQPQQNDGGPNADRNAPQATFPTNKPSQ